MSHGATTGEHRSKGGYRLAVLLLAGAVVCFGWSVVASADLPLLLCVLLLPVAAIAAGVTAARRRLHSPVPDPWYDPGRGADDGPVHPRHHHLAAVEALATDDPGRLRSPAWLLGTAGPAGTPEPGELILGGGVLAFVSHREAEPVVLFSADPHNVTVRAPAMYFGAGLQLQVEHLRYRVSFLPIHSMAGQATSSGTVLVGTSLSLKDLPAARVTTAGWWTALARAGATRFGDRWPLA